MLEDYCNSDPAAGVTADSGCAYATGMNKQWGTRTSECPIAVYTADLSACALSVFSQVKSGSSRPKWP